MLNLRNPIALFTAIALLLTASPALADDSGLDILEAKSAADVEDREAVDVADSFTAGDTVHLWMAIENPGQETQIEVAWHADDSELHSVQLDIGTSPRWRTWALTTVHQTGDWSVEIRDAGGQTLETVEFTVQD